MKAIRILRVIADFAMIIMLPLLMTYSLMGETAHEWMGIGMTVAVILHHVLNFSFYKNIGKGKYTPMRLFSVIVNILLLVCVSTLAVSGILMSRHALPFISFDSGLAVVRVLHLTGSYWGLVLMSFHLGMHGAMLLGLIRKIAKVKKSSVIHTIVLRITAAVISGYGIYIMIHWKIFDYMFLKNQFVFFDFNIPVIKYLLEYSAIILLFAFTGYYSVKGVKALNDLWKGESKKCEQ